MKILEFQLLWGWPECQWEQERFWVAKLRSSSQKMVWAGTQMDSAMSLNPYYVYKVYQDAAATYQYPDA
jgi:hypothetical protein